ncbi:MAG: SpoIIIAH-like family protein, partial [Oscillospiraceae bacterium]
MKKSKIFGKRQVLFAVLVLALAAAVWLNMKYSAENGGFNISGADTSSAVLGETQYVNGELKEETVQTAATNGYFKTARSDRTKAREDAVEMLKETMGDVKIDAAAKQSAIESLAVIAKRIENEAA